MLKSISNLKTGAYFHLLENEAFLQRYSKVASVEFQTILWNRSGKTLLFIDDVIVEVQNNEVITMTGRQYLQIKALGDVIVFQHNREFYCIVDHDHEVSCAGLIFYGGRGNPIIKPNSTLIHKFDLLLKVFYDELSTHDTIQEEMVRMLMKRLIILLTRAFKTQYFQDNTIREREVEAIREFHILVELHFKEKHKVAEYAVLLHKSPKTLSNLFGRLNDQSPLEVIHQRIAIEAKRLLLYTDKTAKEIGFELGFQEEAHFSRFFKKMESISPMKFKILKVA